MTPTQRARKALRAMKDIGIPEAMSKPVLKRLLQVYEKNWELIEEENYRALADAIFESDESEVVDQKKKLDEAEAAEKKLTDQAERMKPIEDETPIQEEPEQPLKRLRTRHRDDQASPSCMNSNINSGENLLKKPKLEVNELPESQPELQSPAKITVTGSVSITDPLPVPPLKEGMNYGKQVDLPTVLIKPKDEPLTDDSPRVEAPHALVMPESSTSRDTSTENNLVKDSDPTKTMNLNNYVQETSNETNGSTVKIDIASSSSGEIKISLTYKSDKGNTKFSFKNEDSLLKTMEDKCLKSYKFLDPKISLTKLMKDMCECFLDLGSDHSGEPPVNTDAISPTENGFVETNHAIPDETVDIAKGQESVVNTDAISPTGLLKTGNDFEKETEKGFEDDNHFIPDETVGMAKGQENTDAVSPTGLLKNGNDFDKETEKGFEESTHCIYDETVDIAQGQGSVVNTDAILPTDSLKPGNDFENEAENRLPTDLLKTGNNFEKEAENKREENNHIIADEHIDIAKGQESVVNTGATSPIGSLKTGNDFEKETENVVEENNYFIPGETIDIAKGEENVVISLVNEVNGECPPSFHYIPRNAVFQNAYVNFSLANITKENCCSTCFGNCLTSSKPCPCALQIGGEFAYTNEGTIKEDVLDNCLQRIRDTQTCHRSYCKDCPLEKPKNEGVLGTCKGHLERSFIKECWLKCGCNKKCGNRIVQCGIRYKLQVFMTPGGKGWGLRALEDLPKGAFVCEFVGEVLTCKELYFRVSQSSKKNEYAHPVFLDAEWGEESESHEDEALCLDPTSYGNVARFINHRCFDANLVEIPVEVENPDRHYYHVAFFTTRKVKALEELTRDYGIEFDDNNDLIKAFECQCGSRFCRNRKRSSGSRKRKCAQN